MEAKWAWEPGLWGRGWPRGGSRQLLPPAVRAPQAAWICVWTHWLLPYPVHEVLAAHLADENTEAEKGRMALLEQKLQWMLVGLQNEGEVGALSVRGWRGLGGGETLPWAGRGASGLGQVWSGVAVLSGCRNRLGQGPPAPLSVPAELARGQVWGSPCRFQARPWPFLALCQSQQSLPLSGSRVSL